MQLGGTKLNEPVPYRVILDRMSHEVPYYAVYLKMAALQGCYCINNTFWRSADDKFFGYAAAEKLGIAEPKTVVLPNRGFVDDVTAESLRNLWPTDFAMYADYVGLPCIMKPAFGGGWKNVHKIHSLDELLHQYNASGSLTMMLQEFISWDTYIRVPTIGRRYARAIRYDPAPGGLGGYNQDYDILPRALRDKAEELSLRYNQALGYDMNALEFAVKDGIFYGIDLTNYTPDLDYRSLKEAHFPWAVEKMATFAIEKALSKERTPRGPRLEEPAAGVSGLAGPDGCTNRMNAAERNGARRSADAAGMAIGGLRAPVPPLALPARGGAELVAREQVAVEADAGRGVAHAALDRGEALRGSPRASRRRSAGPSPARRSRASHAAKVDRDLLVAADHHVAEVQHVGERLGEGQADPPARLLRADEAPRLEPPRAQLEELDRVQVAAAGARQVERVHLDHVVAPLVAGERLAAVRSLGAHAPVGEQLHERPERRDHRDLEQQPRLARGDLEDAHALRLLAAGDRPGRLARAQADHGDLLGRRVDHRRHARRAACGSPRRAASCAAGR